MSKYDEAVQAAMAVLRDEGADSEGGWHSWRCFDRERYPEPCDCTEQVARAALNAALAILNPTMPNLEEQ